MTLDELLSQLAQGQPLVCGTEAYDLMRACSEEARRLTAELNNSYHTEEEIRAIMCRITGADIDSSFRLFPPFYTDFGKNIRFGKNVFVNACCCFQDQGGIFTGDNILIGHRVTIATVNHGLKSDERNALHVAPVHIGNNVWIGSGAIILPGVEIGDDCVIAAGAVVTRNARPGMVVAGVPARMIKSVY